MYVIFVYKCVKYENKKMVAVKNWSPHHDWASYALNNYATARGLKVIVDNMRTVFFLIHCIATLLCLCIMQATKAACSHATHLSL